MVWLAYKPKTNNVFQAVHCIWLLPTQHKKYFYTHEKTRWVALLVADPPWCNSITFQYNHNNFGTKQKPKILQGLFTYDASKQVREKRRVMSVYFKIVWNRGKMVTPSFGEKNEIFRRNHSEIYYLLKVRVLVVLF